MSNVEPKKWKPGVADDVWKVMVCARDAYRAEELIGTLVSILTNAGANTEAGVAQIRQMSGEQIIDAITAYGKSSYDSVKKVLRNPGES